MISSLISNITNSLINIYKYKTCVYYPFVAVLKDEDDALAIAGAPLTLAQNQKMSFFQVVRGCAPGKAELTSLYRNILECI